MAPPNPWIGYRLKIEAARPHQDDLIYDDKPATECVYCSEKKQLRHLASTRHETHGHEGGAGYTAAICPQCAALAVLDFPAEFAVITALIRRFDPAEAHMVVAEHTHATHRATLAKQLEASQ
jgi:glutaredoxin